MTTRFLAGGQNGAGKSTIMCSLHMALRLMDYRSVLIEIDPWSDTHDLILGRKQPHLRNARSEIPLDDFEDRVEHFALSQREIVLGDMQGRSQYVHNGLLAGLADHGILITRNPASKDEAAEFPQRVPDWLELFERLQIHSVIRVHTLQGDQEPEVELPDDAIIMHNIDRNLVPFNAKIQKLALRVLELSKAS